MRVILLLTQMGELREYEASLVDFANMEEGAENIIECIHYMAYQELMSRTIISMWGWEVRTKHMFENNHLSSVGDVVSCQLGKVNRLKGCGYQTRKEVYEVFCMYHLKLKHWSPELHYSKANYKF